MKYTWVTFQVNNEGKKFLIFLDLHVIYSGVKCPMSRGDILKVCKKLGVSVI